MALLKEIVPQEYQGKEYLKPWLEKEQAEALPEVFKKLDNAEALIGKRPVIPDVKTAKPEELEKFFDQFKPEKAEEYEIPIAEGKKADDGFLKVVREAFMAGKINKVQANGFLKTMTAYGQAREKEMADAKAKADAEFDVLAKTALGDGNKAKMEQAKKLIAENAPAVYKDLVGKLDDKSLVIMAGVINAIAEKYVPEDALKAKGGAGTGGAGATAKEKRTEMETLMATKAYSNWEDSNHEATVAKIRQLAKEIAELQAAGA